MVIFYLGIFYVSHITNTNNREISIEKMQLVMFVPSHFGARSNWACVLIRGFTWCNLIITRYLCLHCTSTWALEIAVAFRRFFAMHVYVPETFRHAFKVRFSPVPIVIPSFIHNICGIGLPMAAQCNFTSSFSRTVWLDGRVIIFGGTIIKQNRNSMKVVSTIPI